MKIQLKRSNVLSSGAAKTPTASQLEYGELAVNYNTTDPAIFLKDSNNNVIRISGVGNISDDGLTNVPDGTNPPANPEAGNLWYNSDQGRLYIYFEDADSSQWVDASPDSWDPSSYPDVTNSSAQSGTLDDRYAMVNGGNSFTGNVGIGTTSPQHRLSVERDVGIYRASSDPTLSLSVGGTIASPTKTYNLLIDDSDSDNLQLRDGSTARVTMDGSGNVGIGTSSPRTKLDISGGIYAAAGNQIQITGNPGSAGLQLIGNDSDASYVGTMSAQALILRTNSAERLRIDSSGRLLIGTSSSYGSVNSDDLTIGDRTQSEVGITLGSTVAAGIRFADAGNVSAGMIQYVHNSGGTDYMNFYTNNTERLRIDSSGRTIVGNANVTTGGGNGVIIENYGGVTSWPATNNTSNIFAVIPRNTGVTSAAIRADGTATFGPFNTSSDTTRGIKLTIGGDNANVTVQSAISSSGSNSAFQVLRGDSADQTATINMDGSATFAGYVDFIRNAGNGYGYLAIGPGGSNEKASFVNRGGEIDFELYSNYSGSPTVSINSDGTASFNGTVTLQANLDMQDNDKILVGTGDDLEIFHNGTYSFIDQVGTGSFYLRNHTDNQDIIIQADNGSGSPTNYIICDGSDGNVRLYYYGNQKLVTKSDGVDISGELQCDTLDVDGAVVINGGDVDIVGNNYNVVWDFSESYLKFNDNAKAAFGTGADLQIYHNAADSVIANSGPGELYIKNETNDKDVIIQSDNGSGGLAAYINCDGSHGNVRLYHYGSQKFETTSSGIDVTGSVTADSYRIDQLSTLP